jgi:thioredoxin 1
MKSPHVLSILALAVIFGCSAPEETSEIHAVKYVTSQDFEQEVIQSPVPVLVDFTAVWCGPCKEVDPVIESLVSEMDGRAKIVKLDIDETPDIYDKLRVNGVPTIIFFNNGIEEDRISSPQSRETYVKYLETMIGGENAVNATLDLLEFDSFRRHFIFTKAIEEIANVLEKRPDLLTASFENGQSPLSFIQNKPSVRQNELIEMTLRYEPEIAPHNLVGLGRCEELKAALATDPEAASRPDPDGATPLYVALTRARRLENGGCLRMLLDAGADPSREHSPYYSLSTAVVFSDNVSLMAEFLDKGMDPEVGDTQGNNTLHVASNFGKVDLVRLLTERGANLALKTDRGQTALDMVTELSVSSKTKFEEAKTPELKAYYFERTEALEQIIALLES